MLLVPQTLLGLAQFDPQLREGLAADILELHILQMLPDSFIRVEVRSLTRKVTRKLLELQPVGSPACEEVFYRLAAMYR